MRAMSRRTSRTRDGVLELAGRPLEAQIELLLLQLQHLVVELIDGHGLGVGAFMASALLGNPRDEAGLDRQLGGGKRQRLLAPARPETPSTSNRMRPGLTRQTHNSGVPLPLPMRTSIGFFDTGTSGKMRIQTRPERFMWRVSARRAASIWRAVTRSGSSRLQPVLAESEVCAADVATPWMRPLNALRNLVRDRLQHD